MTWAQTAAIIVAIVITGGGGAWVVQDRIAKLDREVSHLGMVDLGSKMRCTAEPEVSAAMQRILTAGGDVETIAEATEVTILCQRE